MEPAIITNKSGIAIMLGGFEDIRLAQREFYIEITAY
jgi:hypothetical protein